MRYTPAGRPVTVFSVGAARFQTDPLRVGRQAEEWFNVVAWDALAELCVRQVSRGAEAYVEGSLQTRVWTDPKGAACVRVEVAASDVVVLCRSGEQVAQSEADRPTRASSREGRERKTNPAGDDAHNESAAESGRNLP